MRRGTFLGLILLLAAGCSSGKSSAPKAASPTTPRTTAPATTTPGEVTGGARGNVTVELVEGDVPAGRQLLATLTAKGATAGVQGGLARGTPLTLARAAGDYTVSVFVACAAGRCADIPGTSSPVGEIEVKSPGEVTVEVRLRCREGQGLPDCSASTVAVAPPPPAEVQSPPVPAIDGTAYRPQPFLEPILSDSISPRSCSGWMRGTLLSICDPALLKEAWENHTLNDPGPVKVEIEGRKIRAGSNRALVQVVPGDGIGTLLAPAHVTIEGPVSAGSYLLVSARYRRPRWTAGGQALFGRLGMEKGGKATIDVHLSEGKLVFDFDTPKGRLKPLRWIHHEGPGPAAQLPPLPDGYADTPEQAARTYLAAINAHDGQVVCQLLTADARTIFTQDESVSCWETVSGLIGYPHENAEADFHHLELEDVESTYERKSFGVSFTAVPVKLSVYSREREYPHRIRKTEVDDVVWFRRLDGRWRLGKPSRVLFGGGGTVEDVLAVPDPYASKHRKEAEEREKREQEQRVAGSRRATLVDPHSADVRCIGKRTAVKDPAGDPRSQGRPSTGRDGALRDRNDLLEAELAVSGRHVCLLLTFKGEPRIGRVGLTLIRGKPGAASYGRAAFLILRDGRLYAGLASDFAGNELLLEPADAQVNVEGHAVAASFDLPTSFPAPGKQELSELRWYVSSDEADQATRASVQDVVPDRSRRWLMVRQSDGELVPER